ncbi:MAG: hypothetical protein ACI4UN_06030 [Muribaculaceae bacterium]
MKKIAIIMLTAAMAAMSANAQIVKLYKGETVVAEYNQDEVDRVVFEEEKPAAPEDAALANIDGVDTYVKYVQLWADGPRFAEFNLGETQTTGNSSQFLWGEIPEEPGFEYDGTEYDNGQLPAAHDNATQLWGENWRMPTQAELAALHSNCTLSYVQIDGVWGFCYTGKGDFADKSIFLPADNGAQSGNGAAYYWSASSAPAVDDVDDRAYCLYLSDINFGWGDMFNVKTDGVAHRNMSYKVRPVVK